MQSQSNRITTIVTVALLAGALIASFMLPNSLSVPASIAAADPAERVLVGTVRDFHRTDSNIVGDGSNGLCAGNIQIWLPGDKRPIFDGGGYRVSTTWKDSKGRAIAPHIAGARAGVSADRLGLRVNGDILIDEAVIDAYNSNYGPYGVGGNYGSAGLVVTNAISSHAVVIDKALVRGDIRVGPGGDPATVIENKGTIAGSVGAAVEAFEMPSISAPSDPDDLEDHEPTGNFQNGTFTLEGDVNPDDDNDEPALWYTNLTFNNATIVIEGDLRIRVDGRLTLDEANVVLEPEATLTFYVNSSHKVDVKRSSVNTAQGDSTLVTFNQLGTGKIDVHEDSHVYATFVAPQTELDVDKSHVYGGFIGDSLVVKGSDHEAADAGFHVDLSNAVPGHGNSALTVREKIELLDDSTIDSFDSTEGPYSAANSGHDALVTCNAIDKDEKVKVKDSRLLGDVLIGPDGDIDKVLKVEGHGVVAGSIGRQAEPVPIPVVAPPAVGVSVGDLKYDDETLTINTDMRCKKLEMKKSVITISGDVTIRCDDKVHLDDNSHIRLAPGATLTLYVKKDLKLEEGCTLNMDGAVAGDPKNVSIRRTSVGKKGKIEVKKNSSLSAWIQGSKTELKVHEFSHFYGSFVGRKAKIEKDSFVHVDMAYFNECMDLADKRGVAGTAGTGSIDSAEAFDTWYRDVPGTNQSTNYAITLRETAGVWEYLNDDFYPIDYRLFGNDGESHNNYFTYTIGGDFTYVECGGQFVDFGGGDGAWLFVNGKLVMDIGGYGVGGRQYVDLDRFGLEDGEAYSVHLFYASRNALNSVFRLRTNLDIGTDTSVTVSSMFD